VVNSSIGSCLVLVAMVVLSFAIEAIYRRASGSAARA
jgi:hypothetical protein